jgi:hypothetical protein
VLPLKFERSLERVHSRLNVVCEFAGSFDRNLRRPKTATLFPPDSDIARIDPSVAQGTENLREPFEQQPPIVPPTVLITVADEFADRFPIMFLDLGQKIGVVQVDLALRLPKPEKINSPDRSDNDASVESVAESHSRTFHWTPELRERFRLTRGRARGMNRADLNGSFMFTIGSFAIAVFAVFGGVFLACRDDRDET